jgi:hypothetical protein
LVKREVIYFFTLVEKKTISFTCICCILLKHIVVCNINMAYYTPFNMAFANRYGIVSSAKSLIVESNPAGVSFT